MRPSILAKLAGWRGYALAAGLAFLAGAGSTWWLRDQMAAHEKLRQAKADLRQAVKVIATNQKAADSSAEVGTKSAAEQVRIRTVYRTLKQEVPVYVTREADARYPVPVGFVRLYDAAAAGSALPDHGAAAVGADDAPSDVALSEVGDATVDNFGACHADQARLKSLQDYVRGQLKVLAPSG